jgi:hypothetical protein
MSDYNWVTDLIREGYVHFPGLIDAHTIAAARAVIDADLAVNYDPARKPEYDSRSFCPDVLGTPPIVALNEHPGVRAKIGALLDLDNVVFDNRGQVAIRQAHNTNQNFPPHPHIDGFPAPNNGVEANHIQPFALLVGVFLSEVDREFAGNFTVWPGSHYLYEKHFRERGALAPKEGMPELSLGQPRQLMGSPGDVVLCHYQLGHSAAVNTSDNDRYAAFFRNNYKDLSEWESPHRSEAVLRHLANLWDGWKVQPA